MPCPGRRSDVIVLYAWIHSGSNGQWRAQKIGVFRSQVGEEMEYRISQRCRFACEFAFLLVED